MGVEWSGTPVVSNGDRPRISPDEMKLERVSARVDAALDEGYEAERNRRIALERERLWRVAFTEVEQRAYALHELAGGTEEQQAEELRKLQSLITMALGRYQVMVSGRREGTGLYKQMSGGRPLPAYEPLKAPDAVRLAPVPCSDTEPHVGHTVPSIAMGYPDTYCPGVPA